MQLLTPASIIAWIGLSGTFGLYIFLKSLMHDDIIHALTAKDGKPFTHADFALVALLFGLGFGTTTWVAAMGFIFYLTGQIH